MQNEAGDLPSFDPDHDTPAPAAPKKPRRKPMKRRAAVRPAKVKRLRRKRKVGKSPALAAPYKKSQTIHSEDVYAAVRKIMGMKGSDRDAVLDLVQGLSK